ncbi:uncharacterized protein BDZ99DRAFT_574290 [Mytilinidion resinicola]|uniref:F-box domain-containing protein n=1 Tax=Mytilinidion resinicola TaxID=574789 RepID=A0A6A6YDZ1_9PEZI|nr:uncharacterized protein BDZ99DRAFT_574290 [Mytilinidion resinicola]KAF2806067.1 hypothetical protein BDZ99DRAFT_574290 [Mytilinidion resinicola]
MALLTDLPDDILLEILAYFEHSKRDLLRVSSTCRRLLAPARTHIYRTVDILVYSARSFNPGDIRIKKTGVIPRSGNPEPDCNTLYLLLRSLDNNSSIGRLVRSLCLSWNSFPSKSLENARELEKLFKALPNLRHLEISDKKFANNFNQQGPDYPDHTKYILEESSKYPLRSYVLDLGRLTSTKLASAMILPTVETITTPRFCDIGRGTGPLTILDPNLEDFFASRLSAPSNLKNLDLGTYRISLPVLEGILNFAPKLQRLKATLPGRSCRYQDRDYGLVASDRWLNPSTISRALQPVHHTLEELTMVNDRRAWAGTDNTRADFTGFTKLRKMCVAPGFWFKWGAFAYGEHMNIDHGFVADHEDRCGLWELLPPNLEELEIYFQFYSGIFCVSIPHVTKLENMLDMPSKHYHWIQELATFKSTAFPSLRSVRLIEQVLTGLTVGDGISFEEMAWTPPKDLLDSYTEAGVELKVQLRSNYRVKEVEMKSCCAVASAYGRSCCADTS